MWWRSSKVTAYIYMNSDNIMYLLDSLHSYKPTNDMLNP